MQLHRLRRGGQDGGRRLRDYVTRTLLAIQNIYMKVSSENVSTVIQPQKGSAAFKKPNIDHDDARTRLTGHRRRWSR